jgi:hypothetical protein
MLDIPFKQVSQNTSYAVTIGYRRHPLNSEWLAQDEDARTPILEAMFLKASEKEISRKPFKSSSSMTMQMRSSSLRSSQKRPEPCYYVLPEKRWL